MKRVYLFLCLLLGFIAAHAQAPYLVRDINTIHPSRNANLNYLTNINGTIYFSATDGVNGNELWKSDGTKAGTVMVKNINPGPMNSNPSELTNVNGMLYFKANDGINGLDLWKSDGTEAGTVIVKNIGAGIDLEWLTNVNGMLFFVVNSASGLCSLWKSDGTDSGTVAIRQINSVPHGNCPSFLTNMNGILYFSATNDTNGVELWKSNGTASGTVIVKDINSGYSSSGPSYLTTVNNTLYFIAHDGFNGAELWKSDGTDIGTVMVKDLAPGGNSSFPNDLTNVNDTLYFTATTTTGEELWKSDGTEAGTIMIKDIRIGFNSSSPDKLTNVNGVLYFMANDGITGEELWKSDGSDAGTIMVKDIAIGGGSSSPYYLTNMNGILYFVATARINGWELWKSDGTSVGTELVKGSTRLPGYPTNLTSANNKLFFANQAMFDDYNFGTSLWSISSCTLSNDNVMSVAYPARGRSANFNSQKQTTPNTSSCHCDIYNNLIATVNAVGTNPVNDTIDARVWIEDLQPAVAGMQYVKRHYEITPSANVATATGKVTLYFSQSEFDQFNAISSIKLPVNSSDATGKANLLIEKRLGATSDGSGTPSSYTGTIVNINPVDSDIVWNSTLNRWEISFDVTGFGGFFVKTQTTPLPVKWLHVNGTLNDSKQAVITWQVIEHNVEKYTIEKSTDGRNYAPVGTVISGGNGRNNYLYTESTELQGTGFYRILQMDFDGASTYSSTVRLSNEMYDAKAINIYPNPFDHQITISSNEVQTAVLYDMTGKVLQTITIEAGETKVSTDFLQPGMYIIKTTYGGSYKIVK